MPVRVAGRVAVPAFSATGPRGGRLPPARADNMAVEVGLGVDNATGGIL